MVKDENRRRSSRRLNKPLDRIRRFVEPEDGEIDRPFDFSLYEFARDNDPGRDDKDAGDDAPEEEASLAESRSEDGGRNKNKKALFSRDKLFGTNILNHKPRQKRRIPVDKEKENKDKTEQIWKKYLATNGLARKEKASPAKRKAMIGLGIFVSVIMLAAVSYIVRTKALNEKYDALLGVDTFYEGVYVDDIALGGMTLQQGREAIEAKQQKQVEQIKVTVVWNNEEKYDFTSHDVAVAFDTDQIINQAYNEGRTGTKKERYGHVLSLTENPVKLYTTMTVNPDAIEPSVREIANSKEVKAQDPSVSFNPDPALPKEEWFDYTDSSVGIETDDSALWVNVRNAFVNKTYGEIQVPYYEIPAEGGDVDLKAITSEVVTFQSHMSSDPNRMHNVELACSLVNGAVVYPGEEWSMNDTTGERTVEKGFREANVIIGGNQLVPGIAGGVCQVSGTLYNALLRADLEITERHHHSFELSYLTRGRDATVDYGTADLKFVNNKDYPVYIAMYTQGQEVYAEIFGQPLPGGQYIDLYVRTDQVIDPGEGYYVSDASIAKGSPPVVVKERVGIRCTVFAVYYDKDGNKLETKQLYQDYYRPYSEEWHVNPADYAHYTSSSS